MPFCEKIWTNNKYFYDAWYCDGFSAGRCLQQRQLEKVQYKKNQGDESTIKPSSTRAKYKKGSAKQRAIKPNQNTYIQPMMRDKESKAMSHQTNGSLPCASSKFC